MSNEDRPGIDPQIFTLTFNESWFPNNKLFNFGQKYKEDMEHLKQSVEEQKYYTPTIEEFHVGFEYEQFKKVLEYDNIWRFKVNRHTYTKEFWGNTFLSRNLELDLKEGKIRVKHLDQEDIESLMGTPYSISDRLLRFNKEDSSLVFNTYDRKVRIINTKLSSHVAVQDERMSVKLNHTHVFSGYLKNKSELKRLLKQIEYANNSEDNTKS